MMCTCVMSAELGDLPSALARLGLWSVTICGTKCVKHTAGQAAAVHSGYAYWKVCIAESAGTAVIFVNTNCTHYTLTSTESRKRLSYTNAEGDLSSKSRRRIVARHWRHPCDKVCLSIVTRVADHAQDILQTTQRVQWTILELVEQRAALGFSGDRSEMPTVVSKWLLYGKG